MCRHGRLGCGAWHAVRQATQAERLHRLALHRSVLADAQHLVATLQQLGNETLALGRHVLVDKADVHLDLCGLPWHAGFPGNLSAAQRPRQANPPHAQDNAT